MRCLFPLALVLSGQSVAQAPEDTDLVHARSRLVYPGSEGTRVVLSSVPYYRTLLSKFNSWTCGAMPAPSTTLRILLASGNNVTMVIATHPRTCTSEKFINEKQTVASKPRARLLKNIVSPLSVYFYQHPFILSTVLL